MLQSRGLQDMAERLEKHRIAMEERPTEVNVSRFSRLEERYRNAGGYSGEAEARRIVAGLGLPPDRLDLPVPALSGGERRRLELGRILFAGSDVLLLDEPTNHLDSDAKHWLMRFLAGYKGALIVVSHDLALLDAAITRILHLDRDGLVQYRGTYSEYRKARKEDELRLARIVRTAANRDPAAANARGLDAGADGQAGEEGEDARHARRAPGVGGGAGADARAGGPLPVPGAPAQRQARARRRGAHEGLRRAPGLRGRRPSTSAAGSGCSSWG